VCTWRYINEDGRTLHDQVARDFIRSIYIYTYIKYLTSRGGTACAKLADNALSKIIF
jgi:hypothetical protein